MRFALWIVITVLKWAMFLATFPFVHGFPPPAWVSTCWLLFFFGHGGGECFFPGGWGALERIGNAHPVHRRIALAIGLSGGTGLLLCFVVSAAVDHAWWPQPMLGIAALLGLVLFGSWVPLWVGHRDFLIAHFWPRKSTG
jgi:hypothetical protein